jgi:hypothetical protein
MTMTMMVLHLAAGLRMINTVTRIKTMLITSSSSSCSNSKKVYSRGAIQLHD